MLFGEIGRFRVSTFTSRHDVSYGGFLGHRGTPFHHPDFTGIFPELNHPATKGYPHDYGPPYVRPHWILTGNGWHSHEIFPELLPPPPAVVFLGSDVSRRWLRPQERGEGFVRGFLRTGRFAQN